jgi:hypothetical protein
LKFTTSSSANSAEIEYPVPLGGPGTREDPFPAKAGPNGDVVVKLKFWRPQRRPIPPETGEWIDMGGLDLGAISESFRFCDKGSYSSGDPNLRLVDGGFQGEPDQAGFKDQQGDRPASPDNTFTYRLNLTKCLKSDGKSFKVGKEREFGFKAVTPQLDAADETARAAAFIRE